MRSKMTSISPNDRSSSSGFESNTTNTPSPPIRNESSSTGSKNGYQSYSRKSGGSKYFEFNAR